MKNKDKFLGALETLFYSWGHDTPAEAYWTANELLDWFEVEYEVKLNIRFHEEGNSNYDEVIAALSTCIDTLQTKK